MDNVEIFIGACVSIVFSILMFITGYPLYFIISGIAGVITGFCWLFSTASDNGVIWVNQNGDFHGGLFYQRGSLTSELSESYVVKYMQDSELLTVITDKPLRIDGNFTLQERVTTEQTHNTVWANIDSENSTTEWFIHLPSLPQNNQTTNGDYILVP